MYLSIIILQSGLSISFYAIVVTFNNHVSNDFNQISYTFH